MCNIEPSYILVSDIGSFPPSGEKSMFILALLIYKNILYIKYKAFLPFIQYCIKKC